MKTIAQKTTIRAKQWAQQPKRRNSKLRRIHNQAVNRAKRLEGLELKAIAY